MNRFVALAVTALLLLAVVPTAHAQVKSRRASKKDPLSGFFLLKVEKGGKSLVFKKDTAKYYEGSIRLVSTIEGNLKGIRGKVTVRLFSYEGVSGGNDWGQIVTVYSQTSPASIEAVATTKFDSSNPGPQVSAIHLEGGALILTGSAYAEGDPHCCPSYHHVTVCYVQAGGLKPIKEPIYWKE